MFIFDLNCNENGPSQIFVHEKTLIHNVFNHKTHLFYLFLRYFTSYLDY